MEIEWRTTRNCIRHVDQGIHVFKIAFTSNVAPQSLRKHAKKTLSVGINHEYWIPTSPKIQHLFTWAPSVHQKLLSRAVTLKHGSP